MKQKLDELPKASSNSHSKSFSQTAFFNKQNQATRKRSSSRPPNKQSLTRLVVALVLVLVISAGLQNLNATHSMTSFTIQLKNWGVLVSYHNEATKPATSLNK